MKKTLIILMIFLTFSLVAFDEATIAVFTQASIQNLLDVSTAVQESPCKNTPLAEGCYIPSDDLEFISSTPEEYTILETFETDRLNQIPRNWLLYSNPEYVANGVFAKVIEDDANQFVELYSDGLQKPLYPQSAPTPTFIFTSKFNLDIARSGIAYVDVMVPSENKNAVSVGVSTGAVNAISVTIDNDLSVVVKVGGPFYYYSQNGDGGEYFETDLVATTDTWYSFKFEWNASENYVKAYWLDGETEVLLHSDTFHISNRFNASATGAILVPNVFKVTMPYGQSGYAYLDNVIVERMDGE